MHANPAYLDSGRHELPPKPIPRNSILRFVFQVWLVSTFAIYAARLAAGFAPNAVLFLLGMAAVGYAAIGTMKAAWRKKVWGMPIAFVALLPIGGLAIVLYQPQRLVGPPFTLQPGVVFFFAMLAATVFVSSVCDRTTRQSDQYGAFGYAATALVVALATLIGDNPAVVDALRKTAGLLSVLFWVLALEVYAGYTLAHKEHTPEKLENERAWWLKRRKWIRGATVTLCGVSVLSLGAWTVLAPQQPPPQAEIDRVNEVLWNTTLLVSVVAVILVLAPVYARRELRAMWRAVVVWTLYDGPDNPGIYRPRNPLGSAKTRQAILAGVVVLNVLATRVQLSAADAFMLTNCVTVARAVETQPLARVGLAAYAASFVLPLITTILLGGLYSLPMSWLHRRIEEAPPDEPYKRPGTDGGEGVAA